MSRQQPHKPIRIAAAVCALLFTGFSSAHAQTAPASNSGSLACQPHQECWPLEPGANISRGFEVQTSPALQTGSEISRKYVEAGAKDGRFQSVDWEIYFDFNSAVIGPKGRATLDDISRKIEALPSEQRRNHFNVIGYTDAKGSSDYNQKLSDQRARAVAAYLADNKIIELALLDPYGRGKTDLKAPDQPFAAVNRRVRLINVGSNVAAADVKTPSATSAPANNDKAGCTRFEPRLGTNITIDCP